MNENETFQNGNMAQAPKKKFPKWAIVLIIVGICVFGIVGCYTSTYNNLVKLDVGVENAWSNVQSQYQRRLDLIPNLVNTVKGAAAHEEEVLTQVAEARASAGGQVNVTADILNDPEAFAKFQQVQDNLASSLQRLLMVTESNPVLQANENFLALQDQIEGTENRIATERMKFNEAVSKYNSSIRKFPGNIVASMSGLEKKQMFIASEEAQSAPSVEF